MSAAPEEAPGDSRDHPAVVHLRAAVAAALNGRARQLSELVEHDQRRAARARLGPNFGPYWRDFANDAHDLSAHASGAVKASQEGSESALATLQALCDAAADRGWVVQSKPDGCWLVMSAEGMTVRATVRERFAPSEFRRETPLGPVAENAKTGTGSFVLVVEGVGATELKFEGNPEELQKKIRTGGVFERIRRRVENVERQKPIAAARRVEERRRYAEVMAAHQENERRRVAAALEVERRQVLARDALAWEQAETIRRYVSHAVAAGADPSWGEWALQVAADIDPSMSASQSATPRGQS